MSSRRAVRTLLSAAPAIRKTRSNQSPATVRPRARPHIALETEPDPTPTAAAASSSSSSSSSDASCALMAPIESVLESDTKKWAPKSKAPPNWERQYAAIVAQRARTPAPVDSMGCSTLSDAEADPKVERYQILIGLMLSSQTKDQVRVRGTVSCVPFAALGARCGAAAQRNATDAAMAPVADSIRVVDDVRPTDDCQGHEQSPGAWADDPEHTRDARGRARPLDPLRRLPHQEGQVRCLGPEARCWLPDWLTDAVLVPCTSHDLQIHPRDIQDPAREVQRRHPDDARRDDGAARRYRGPLQQTQATLTDTLPCHRSSGPQDVVSVPQHGVRQVRGVAAGAAAA